MEQGPVLARISRTGRKHHLRNLGKMVVGRPIPVSGGLILLGFVPVAAFRERLIPLSQVALNVVCLSS